MTYHATPLTFAKGDFYHRVGLSTEARKQLSGGAETYPTPGVRARLNELEAYAGITLTAAGASDTHMTIAASLDGEATWRYTQAIDRARNALFGCPAVGGWGFDPDEPGSDHIAIIRNLSDFVGAKAYSDTIATLVWSYDVDDEEWSETGTGESTHGTGIYQKVLAGAVAVHELWVQPHIYLKDHVGGEQHEWMDPPAYRHHYVDVRDIESGGDITWSLKYTTVTSSPIWLMTFGDFAAGTDTGITLTGSSFSNAWLDISAIWNAWYPSILNPPTEDLVFYWWPTTDVTTWPKGTIDHEDLVGQGPHNDQYWVMLYKFDQSYTSQWHMKE